ncbi:HopJ type III effector protein [Colwellia psychrerythraea]|uniref:HopJ type III effector protein n=1 Tax=Colwellia psychrerythraea TaxID=28229 RepID=A0A099K6V2_COLPS|nr:HopJ type III effector protein [Colwellia psychrerythraea]KGJ86519.1 HopJ type III effector protein [Colwellia psychrerythraea]
MASVAGKHALADFIDELSANAEKISFEQVMHVISEHYNYTPASFSNGDLVNEAGTNEGSCKIFYFAKLNQFTEQQTLNCFGRFYRDDVVKNPQGNDHANIRNFIQNGWSKVKFNTVALSSLV